MTTIKSELFNANDIIKTCISEAVPGNPKWANLAIGIHSRISTDKFTGPGIYAFFFDNKLIYIGKFLGLKTDPFRGDIIQSRWTKHIGTFSSRGRQLSFSKKSISNITKQPRSIVASDIYNSNMLTLKRDRGMISTYKRFSFAENNWEYFKNFDEVQLKRFSILYVRLNKDSHLDTNTEQVRSFINQAEDELIKEIQPLCNATIETGPSTIDHSIDQVHEMIKTKLERTYMPIKRAKTAKPDMSLPKAQEITVDIDESRSAEDVFFEQISSSQSAVNFARKIQEVFYDDPNFEVHYTYTNGADMRIRTRINIFTLDWRHQRKLFLCRTLSNLGIESKNHKGIFDFCDKNYRLSQEFKLDPQLCNIETCIQIIRDAASRDI